MQVPSNSYPISNIWRSFFISEWWGGSSQLREQNNIYYTHMIVQVATLGVLGHLKQLKPTHQVPIWPYLFIGFVWSDWAGYLDLNLSARFRISRWWLQKKFRDRAWAMLLHLLTAHSLIARLKVNKTRVLIYVQFYFIKKKKQFWQATVYIWKFEHLSQVQDRPEVSSSFFPIT